MMTYIDISNYVAQIKPELNQYPGNPPDRFDCSGINNTDLYSLKCLTEAKLAQLGNKIDDQSLLFITVLSDLLNEIKKYDTAPAYTPPQDIPPPPYKEPNASVGLYPSLPTSFSIPTIPQSNLYPILTPGNPDPSPLPTVEQPAYLQLHTNIFATNPQPYPEPSIPGATDTGPNYHLAAEVSTYAVFTAGPNDIPPPPYTAPAPMTTQSSESLRKLKEYFEIRNAPMQLPTTGLTTIEMLHLKTVLTDTDQRKTAWIFKFTTRSLSDRDKLMVSRSIIGWLNTLLQNKIIDLHYIMDLFLTPARNLNCFYHLCFNSSPECMGIFLGWIEEYGQNPLHADRVLALFYKKEDIELKLASALIWCFRVDSIESKYRLEKIVRDLAKHSENPLDVLRILYHPRISMGIGSKMRTLKPKELKNNYKQTMANLLLKTHFNERTINEIKFIFNTKKLLVNAITTNPDKDIQLACCKEALRHDSLLNQYLFREIIKEEALRAELIAVRDSIVVKPQDINRILYAIMNKEYESIDLPDPQTFTPEMLSDIFSKISATYFNPNCTFDLHQTFLQHFFTKKYNANMQLKFIHWLQTLCLRFETDINPIFAENGYNILNTKSIPALLILISKITTPAVFDAFINLIRTLMNDNRLSLETCKRLLEGTTKNTPYNHLSPPAITQNKVKLAALQSLRREAIIHFGFEHYTYDQITNCFKNREQTSQMIQSASPELKLAALTESQREGSALNKYFKSISSSKTIRQSLKSGYEQGVITTPKAWIEALRSQDVSVAIDSLASNTMTEADFIETMNLLQQNNIFLTIVKNRNLKTIKDLLNYIVKLAEHPAANRELFNPLFAYIASWLPEVIQSKKQGDTLELLLNLEKSIVSLAKQNLIKHKLVVDFYSTAVLNPSNQQTAAPNLTFYFARNNHCIPAEIFQLNELNEDEIRQLTGLLQAHQRITLERVHSYFNFFTLHAQNPNEDFIKVLKVISNLPHVLPKTIINTLLNYTAYYSDLASLKKIPLLNYLVANATKIQTREWLLELLNNNKITAVELFNLLIEKKPLYEAYVGNAITCLCLKCPDLYDFMHQILIRCENMLPINLNIYVGTPKKWESFFAALRAYKPENLLKMQDDLKKDPELFKVLGHDGYSALVNQINQLQALPATVAVPEVTPPQPQLQVAPANTDAFNAFFGVPLPANLPAPLQPSATTQQTVIPLPNGDLINFDEPLPSPLPARSNYENDLISLSVEQKPESKPEDKQSLYPTL